MPGGSAESSREIEVGDVVESINDLFLQGPQESVNIHQAEALLNGTAGTVCRLGIRKRDGKFCTVRLARLAIDLVSTARSQSPTSPMRSRPTSSPMPSARMMPSPAPSKTFNQNLFSSRQSSASPMHMNRHPSIPGFEDTSNMSTYAPGSDAGRENQSTRIGVNLDMSPHGGVCISSLSPLGW